MMALTNRVPLGCTSSEVCAQVAGDDAAAGQWGAGGLYRPNHGISGALAMTGEQRSDANKAAMGYLPYGLLFGSLLKTLG